MSPTPTAPEIIEFRAATGLGVNDAKEFLQTRDKGLIRKILEAASLANQKAGNSRNEPNTTENSSKLDHLIDPIEHDPVRGPIVEAVRKEEEARIRAENDDQWKLGYCHLIWRRMKERLANEHGIEWHSPAELNPGSVFD
ncbi:MAG: hypothetical protein CMO55_26885 [Verrucomicrobiales bacterium]|nr:hypothetical protein [Verrucomicrobiales bacterium]